MSYKTQYGIEGVNLSDWSAFVLSHKDGNIFQTPEMYNFWKVADNHEPLAFFSFDEENKINGCLIAFVQKQFSGPLNYFSARGIIWGGPLVLDDNCQIAKSLLEEYEKVISKKALYTQVRNLHEVINVKKAFLSNGYNYEEHLNFLVDLTLSEEELWKNVNQKRRNEIRRAEKEGATFGIIDNMEDFAISYQILTEVYKRAGLPLPKYNFFESAYKLLNPTGNMIAFGAYFESKLIGVMYIFIQGNKMFDWYAGSFREYYKKYPNDLLPWKVFLWGKEKGLTQFDFGGAGKPDEKYGVRDYKEKFGGSLVNYGRFEKVHNKTIYKLAVFAFNLFRRLKKK